MRPLAASVLLSAALAAVLTSPPVCAEIPKPEKFDETGFVAIFDGKTLDGWKVSAKTGHSGKSKNKSGGKWVVESGAIVGSQDEPGNGGIVITEKQYGDFEVALEMNNDDGPDSGLFLRSTDTGKCYQAMIDYHKGGNPRFTSW
ncbi:3-keto-disaccharide hydrolase [Gemmata sp.]|uniref:3-keto-disaccharide hydrolase n=1 Tax=Gemmata sp. TaxID=1914242 RepID=UPI003F6E86C2